MTATTGSWYVATTYGNPVPDIYTDTSGSSLNTVTLTDGGGSFTFSSVDLSSSSVSSSQYNNYVINGYLGLAQVFTQSGNVFGGQGNTFINVAAIQPGSLITSLTISAGAGNGSPAANLDNIVFGPASVAVTPEPSSLVLLGTSALGVVGVLKRRLA